MTTQREVIDAFLDFENEPDRASNFRMVKIGGGETAFLVSAGGVVVAKREPIRRVKIWTRRPHLYGWDYQDSDRVNIGWYGIRDQITKVRRAARNRDESNYATFDTTRDEAEPVSNFERLEAELYE
jgi:hypothetical protein